MIDQVKSEYRRMRKQLATEHKDRDRLIDQLNWLSYQISYYSENGELEKLAADYNWVVSNVNEALQLKGQEAIVPYQKFRKTA